MYLKEGFLLIREIQELEETIAHRIRKRPAFLQKQFLHVTCPKARHPS